VFAHDEERGWLQAAVGDAPVEMFRDVDGFSTLELRVGRQERQPRFRLDGLPSLYEQMLAHDLPLSASDHARLRAFRASFARLCGELAAAGVPETMQHDDLHGNNVCSYNGVARILDWGDSCMSHPFLTLFVTFLHLEEMEGLARGDPWFARLRDAYLEPWGRPGEHRETFEVAQRIGPFAHVFKELRVLDAIPEKEGHLVRNLPDILARCIAIAA